MSLFRQLRRLTLIELLAVAAVIAVLAAILIPATQWVADGWIEFPVRVFVFDANELTPVANAQITIFRSPPLSSPHVLTENREFWDLGGRAAEGVTDKTGSTRIEHQFTTSASHNRPVSHVHVHWAWAKVTADGYGGVVVPVSTESIPTKELRKRTELTVPIGLIKHDPQQ